MALEITDSNFSRNPGRGKTGSYGFLGTLVRPL